MAVVGLLVGVRGTLPLFFKSFCKNFVFIICFLIKLVFRPSKDPFQYPQFYVLFLIILSSMIKNRICFIFHTFNLFYTLVVILIDVSQIVFILCVHVATVLRGQSFMMSEPKCSLYCKQYVQPTTTAFR